EDRLRVRRIVGLALLFLMLTSPTVRAGYVAVSLGQIEVLSRTKPDAAVGQNLADINQIFGLVVAPDGELIVVGRHDPTLPPLHRDDLASALRAAFLHKASPLVSLDPAPDLLASGRLKVRFEGGVANTRLGHELLQADIGLK